jgi:ferredoxin-NADP reductase
VRALSKELKKYPDAELVEVEDANQHVRIRTHNGRLLIDVNAPDETVHVACPLAMIEDVSRQLEAQGPAV